MHDLSWPVKSGYFLWSNRCKILFLVSINFSSNANMNVLILWLHNVLPFNEKTYPWSCSSSFSAKKRKTIIIQGFILLDQHNNCFDYGHVLLVCVTNFLNFLNAQFPASYRPENMLSFLPTSFYGQRQRVRNSMSPSPIINGVLVSINVLKKKVVYFALQRMLATALC